jgi:hypothetical protein
MWSPTLLFDLRAYGPEKLSLVTQKGFCNTIGTKRTSGSNLTMSAAEGRTDLPFKWGHFRF